MSNTKIGVISPYAEFTEIVHKLARDQHLDVIVREEITDRLVISVKEWEDNGQVEIVIARGVTTALLKGKVKIPIVNIEVTSFDIAEAIFRAKDAGDEIILVDYEHKPMSLNYSKISEMLRIDFRTIIYQCEKQLDRILKDIAANKYVVVVSTGIHVLQKAIELGLKTVLVHSSPEFISDALNKAWYISKVRKKDLHLCNRFQSILNNAHDGIMAVENGEVTIFNPVAEKITGMNINDVLDKPIAELCRLNATLRALYGNGKPVNSQILHLGDLPMIVNRVTVQLGQNNHGITVTFQAADKFRRIEAKIRQELHNLGLVAKFRFSNIIGHSAMISETIKEARKYARSEAAVLITGESGTGKELFAQSMHNESNRKEGPFVAINCAALPENLLESELFGYEEGAFTGARKGGKQGLFALAHGGTIFLDEVGELSPGLQARLLRVLQEKEIMPVGGQRVIPVDVRVISATNQNLINSVNQGNFRKDLFYRISVLNLHIPPLRERLEDVPLLFKHFLLRLGGPDIMESLNINDNMLEALKKYLWPGNVRELEGFTERYIALGEDNITNHATFNALLAKLKMTAKGNPSTINNNHFIVEYGNMIDMEKQILAQAIKLFQGSKGEMARALGISRSTLWKRLKEFGLDSNKGKDIVS
ncbi:sigma-54-dependent Fis family transcriptional regulator [Desulfotruncus alcoholivorax]|uniref:sigma-54-dependent Fis family transcriptional regulator n=1 Tax=Desulfotruncus alcoholivorax TaxID=265477 RepID=UPI0004198C2A|nr:sigma-54-dependent Fis family transcriptional regulator [Desulfotruncus alcoholivorax]